MTASVVSARRPPPTQAVRAALLQLPVPAGAALGVATEEELAAVDGPPAAGRPPATELDAVGVELHPAEAALVTGAPPERRQDFALGRLAARRALARLGAPPAPVLARGPVPVFPLGVAGSISHCSGVAVALAGRRPPLAAVGVDVALAELPARAARLVCGRRERSWVAADTAGRRLVQVFAAKEAVVKLAADRFGAPLRLSAVRTRPVPGGFRARVRPRGGRPFTVRVSCHDLGWIVLTWAEMTTADLTPTAGR
jgi:hypothetical protein